MWLAWSWLWMKAIRAAVAFGAPRFTGVSVGVLAVVRCGTGTGAGGSAGVGVVGVWPGGVTGTGALGARSLLPGTVAAAGSVTAARNTWNRVRSCSADQDWMTVPAS